MREHGTEEHAPCREGEVHAVHGTRHADICEPALFFEFGLVGERARMGEHAFFETGEEHDRKLETLCTVQRH